MTMKCVSRSSDKTPTRKGRKRFGMRVKGPPSGAGL
jgi:hypothetical protein